MQQFQRFIEVPGKSPELFQFRKGYDKSILENILVFPVTDTFP